MLSTEQRSHQCTLEEYLNCSDIISDRLCELENGRIQEMLPESWQNHFLPTRTIAGNMKGYLIVVDTALLHRVR